jgi:hypothetical protein
MDDAVEGASVRVLPEAALRPGDGMTTARYTGFYTRRICLILKTIRRDGWMTRNELIAALGVPANGDQMKLLRMLEDEGFLDSRKRVNPLGKSGTRPEEFALSASWRDDAPRKP